MIHLFILCCHSRCHCIQARLDSVCNNDVRFIDVSACSVDFEKQVALNVSVLYFELTS